MEEVGRGEDEGGRSERRVAPSTPVTEGAIETVCFELDSEMMLKRRPRAGEVSWLTTCLPTSPTPIMATETADTARGTAVSSSQETLRRL